MEPRRPRAVNSATSGAPRVSTVRRLRHRHIIDRLDYLRGLRQLAEGMTQADLAQALGLTQPSISSALKSAAKISDPPAGFCGASAYEIAQRFIAGEISRDDLVDQLSRWQDVPGNGSGESRPAANEPEAMRDLGKALRDGLLDESAYQTVLHKRRSLGRP